MNRRSLRWPYTLQRLELFAECSDRELGRVAPLLSETKIEAGRILLREGSRDRQFVVIAEGHALVTQGHGAGSRVLATVGPGSFVGEIALLEGVPRSATVTSVTPLTIYTATEREFVALMASAPSAGAKITSIASEREEQIRAAA